MRFSVVIPAYNPGAYLVESVESALAQTDVENEVIVVDDGSTDGTRERLAGFAPRVRVITQENAGVSVARNTGVHAARHPWLAFLDADDRWRPGHLGRLARAIKANEAATLVHTDAMQIDEAGEEMWPLRAREPAGDDPFIAVLSAGNPVITSTASAPRDAVREAGGFQPGLKSAEDWHLWLRLMTRGRRAHVRELSVDYRKQRASAVHTRGAGMREDALWVLDEARKLRPDLDEEVLEATRAVLALQSAERLLVAGDAREARRDVARSLRHRVRSPRGWLYLALALSGDRVAGRVLGTRRELRRRRWSS